MECMWKRMENDFFHQLFVFEFTLIVQYVQLDETFIIHICLPAGTVVMVKCWNPIWYL